MKKKTRIIISPYFSNNTNLVANFCKWCYLRADDLLITSVNVIFLKNHDLHEYLNLKFNWLLKTDTPYYDGNAGITPNAFPKGFPQKEIFESVKLKNISYQKLMNLRIIKKYKYFYRKYLLRNHKNERVPEKKRKRFCINDTNNSEMNMSRSDENEEKFEFIFHLKRANIKKELVEEEELKLSSGKVHSSQIFLTEMFKTELDEKPIGIKSNCDNQVTQSKINALKWIPPISPHNLIEERFYHDPWALLVVTIFLNRTSCNMALPYMDKFFDNFKGPYDVLKTEILELEPYFYKIGLVRTRATQVWRMSYDFVHKDWKSVKELYGVGKYAEDAYRMFHLGDFTVQPTDRYLKIYKAWYDMTRKETELGVFTNNSQVYLEDYYVAPEDDEDRREENFEEEVY